MEPPQRGGLQPLSHAESAEALELYGLVLGHLLRKAGGIIIIHRDDFEKTVGEYDGREACVIEASADGAYMVVRLERPDEGAVPGVMYGERR